MGLADFPKFSPASRSQDKLDIYDVSSYGVSFSYQVRVIFQKEFRLNEWDVRGEGTNKEKESKRSGQREETSFTFRRKSGACPIHVIPGVTWKVKCPACHYQPKRHSQTLVSKNHPEHLSLGMMWEWAPGELEELGNRKAHRNELVEYSLALDLLIMQPCLHERAAKDEEKRDPKDGEDADSLLHPFPICSIIPSHIWPISYDWLSNAFILSPTQKGKGAGVRQFHHPCHLFCVCLKQIVEFSDSHMQCLYFNTKSQSLISSRILPISTWVELLCPFPMTAVPQGRRYRKKDRSTIVGGDIPGLVCERSFVLFFFRFLVWGHTQ